MVFLWCSDMLFDKRYKIIMMINESRLGPDVTRAPLGSTHAPFLLNAGALQVVVECHFTVL
ncbi:hypothetical protein HW555_013141 [Spodoptera exigua]|uniref:Uncharacterized protein n=1 Tax=Spodoptera exigua TaxID=7107 RepID=A0A835G5P2_SPOEX|nr:hypothetical protein HW555_013141 [Spodoptera exigua]